jgi:hypothetical protein
MNAIAEIKPTNMVDLSPQTFEQALTFASYLADSEMVPKDFKGKPGNCLIAMQWGAEIGLKPLQSLQNLAVINGRPALWGDSVIALVRASPACEYILEEDNGHTATCKVKRRGEPEQYRTFSMEDAKTAGLLGKQGPWMQYPKRMRQMRARAFALRDVFPDVLRGLPVAEEVMDAPVDMGPANVVADAPNGPSDELLQKARDAAAKGMASYQSFWADTSKEDRKLLAGEHEGLKAEAKRVDNARTVDAEPKADKTASSPIDPPTPADVLKRINEAKNLDALMVAADWINAITDTAEGDQLTQRYLARAAEFEGK